MKLPTPLSQLESLMPRAYVRQIFCFSSTKPHDAVKCLEQSLPGLIKDVPYLLSRVIRDDSTGSPPMLGEQCGHLDDLLSYQDLSGSINYDDLKGKNFPPGDLLIPGIIPKESQPPYSAEPPVFRARISLLHGGLLLCVAVHHSTTDITGFGSLLRVWSSHCRGIRQQEPNLNPACMNRGLLNIAASPPHQSTQEGTSAVVGGVSVIPDFLHIRKSSDMPGPTSTKDKMKTAIFYFPLARLRALKNSVCEQIDAGKWVSTGDILTALLWAAVIEAENSTALDADLNMNKLVTRLSTLSFPVQFRSALRPPLPLEFLGAAFLMTNAIVSHENLDAISQSRAPASADLVNSALGKVALEIRRSIQKVDDQAVHAVLAFLKAHGPQDFEGPLILGPPRKTPGGSNASVVSWAEQGVYELDWGQCMSQCEAVRLPKMGYKRDPIVLPRVPPKKGVEGDEGGFEVIVSFEEKMMQKLIEGSAIKGWATLRCLS
ncbi:transferase family-domain-containing protein [Xylariaceae sp. FL0255]|nr:transferase family-domain-containing protein [Xylariaceae sp. FL0255]